MAMKRKSLEGEVNHAKKGRIDYEGSEVDQMKIANDFGVDPPDLFLRAATKSNSSTVAKSTMFNNSTIDATSFSTSINPSSTLPPISSMLTSDQSPMNPFHELPSNQVNEASNGLIGAGPLNFLSNNFNAAAPAPAATFPNPMLANPLFMMMNPNFLSATNPMNSNFLPMNNPLLPNVPTAKPGLNSNFPISTMTPNNLPMLNPQQLMLMLQQQQQQFQQYLYLQMAMQQQQQNFKQLYQLPDEPQLKTREEVATSSITSNNHTQTTNSNHHAVHEKEADENSDHDEDSVHEDEDEDEDEEGELIDDEDDANGDDLEEEDADADGNDEDDISNDPGTSNHLINSHSTDHSSKHPNMDGNSLTKSIIPSTLLPTTSTSTTNYTSLLPMNIQHQLLGNMNPPVQSTAPPPLLPTVNPSNPAESHPSEMRVRAGRWTKHEHELFLEGMRKYGKQWTMIAKLIGTRNPVQVRTHAQKHFNKIAGLKLSQSQGHITKFQEESSEYYYHQHQQLQQQQQQQQHQQQQQQQQPSSSLNPSKPFKQAPYPLSSTVTTNTITTNTEQAVNPAIKGDASSQSVLNDPHALSNTLMNLNGLHQPVNPLLLLSLLQPTAAPSSSQAPLQISEITSKVNLNQIPTSSTSNLDNLQYNHPMTSTINPPIHSLSHLDIPKRVAMKKYRHLTLTEKVAIIQKYIRASIANEFIDQPEIQQQLQLLQQQLQGEQCRNFHGLQAEIAREYNVTPSTISQLLKRKEEILQQYEVEVERSKLREFEMSLHLLVINQKIQTQEEFVNFASWLANHLKLYQSHRYLFIENSDNNNSYSNNNNSWKLLPSWITKFCAERKIEFNGNNQRQQQQQQLE